MSTLPVGMGGSGFQPATIGGEVDNTASHPGHREPLVLGMDTFGEVTRTVCRVAEAKRPGAARSVSSKCTSPHGGHLFITSSAFCQCYILELGSN
ncbi:MAG: hypothetical protein ACO396_03605, partial [Phycisphaerales bacterium]